MALRHGASRIVFVSDQLKNDVACKLRLPDSKCVVIHNGIDVDKYVPRRNASMRVSLGLGAEDILIGALGNIRKPKAYDVLLDAAHLICREHSNVHFVIAGQGSGALLNELLTQRARLNLERRIHFIGFCSNVQEFLNGIDIYALSSTTEGFSISCIEAMACSVPVVATRSGGPETIVSPGESGLLVRPGSATDLAGALRQLLASPELRAKLATSGRSRVLSYFDSKLMMNQYRTLLVDAIGSSSKLSDSIKDR
jgi:glycosyltransferase involved in cell wall biosynthesis